MKLDTSSFFVKLQSTVLHFCHLTNFTEGTKETDSSVNSSSPLNNFYHLTGFFFTIIILLAVMVKLFFFCQIIMGSQLNNNVPEGRSVNRYDKSKFHRFENSIAKLHYF